MGLHEVEVARTCMYVLLVKNINLNRERMRCRFQSWTVSPQVGMALHN